MKKITFLMLTLLLSLAGYSQLGGTGTEGFESTTGPDLSPSTNWTLGTGNWSVFDNGVGTSRWGVNTLAYEGVNAAYCSRDNIGAGNTQIDYLVSPSISVPANGELHFFTRMFSNGNTTSIYQIKFAIAGSDLSDPMSYTLLQEWNEADLLTGPYNVYEEKVVPIGFLQPLGLNIHIAFILVNVQDGAGSQGDRWLVDNVSVVAQCPFPANLTANNISQNSAQLSWDNPSGATSWEIEILPQADTPTGTGIVYSGALPYTATATQPANVPFTPTTAYKYYVRAMCTGGPNSQWIGPFSFTTSSPGLSCSSPIQITSLPYSTTDNTANYSDNVDIEGSPGASCNITGNYLNGNDVVYSYTATANSTISVTMTPTANNSGVFAYDSCANVGVTCVGGAAGTNNTVRTFNLPVTAGQTYYFVISSSTTQTTAYTLVIQTVNCAPPANLTATGVSQTAATLSWAAGGSTSWEIVVQESVPGGIPTGSGTTTTNFAGYVVPTTLTPNTNYEFYVRADCNDGTGNFSAWAGPFAFRTLCDAFNVPFQEGFNSTSTTEGCWTVLNLNGDTDAWNMNYDVNPFEGNQSAMMFTDGNGTGPNNNNDWLISPQIILTANQRLRYRYRVQSANEPNDFRVMLSTSGANPVEFTQELVALTSYNNIVYQEAIVNLSAYTGPVNIGWHVPPGGLDGWRLYIDNVIIEDLPTCPEPSMLTATTVLSTSATLSWTNGNAETEWQILALPCLSPAPTAAATGFVTTTTGSPYILTGLTPTTCYDVYIRAVCPGNDLSPWTGPATFTTQVAPPVCGGQYVDAGGSAASYPATSNSTVTICPPAGELVTVTFTSFDTETNYDALYVFDGNSTSAPQIASTNPANNVPGGLAGGYWGTTIPGPFVSSVPGGCLTFNFRSDLSIQNAGWVANVTCGPAPTCTKPNLLTATSVTTDSAQIGWNQVANPDTSIPTAWEVLVLSCTDPAPTAASTGGIPTTQNPYSLTGLTANTCYKVYVRAVCSTTDSSEWSSAVTFTTQCVAFPIPFLEGFNSDSTSEACWTVLNLNGDADAWNMNYAVNPYEGNQSAMMFTDGNGTGPNNNNDWLISPQITGLNGNQRLRYRYRVQSANEPNDFRVMLSSTGIDPANFTQTIVPLASYNNITYVENIVELTGVTGSINIGFHVPQGGLDGWRLYIDRVVIENIPTCPEPTALISNTVLSTSATISWTAGVLETEWQLLALPCGTTTPNGTATGFVTATTNPFTLTDLTPTTCYDIYVRAVCPGNDLSPWTGPTTFTTQVAPPVCGGQYIDAGGSAADYPNNSNSTVTICPPAGELVTVTFTSFNTEATWDGIYVYDGNSVGAPQIASANAAGNGPMTTPGAYWGTTIPGPFTSTSLDGCLTFNFRSDGGGVRAGWVANVTCGPAPTCFPPTDLTAATLTGSYSVNLTWTPTGSETQWEVFVQEIGTGAPNASSVGTIVDSPNFSYLASEDIFYEYYVRAVCSADDISVWSSPEQFSIFIPPGCAAVDVVGVGIDIVDSAIVICPDSNITEVNLEASFYGIAATTTYEVESIDYNPPYPFVGGIQMPITSDDDYTPSFELPFNFCFFGESYDYCQVGDNGIIAFGRPFTTVYGQFCEWDLDNLAIPNAAFPTRNAIYGVYQDLLTTNNPIPETSVNYQVLGTYPCRALVVNFNEVPAFGGSCSGPEFRMTTQIVLYEISNIIEVYVNKRTACTTWSDGQGVLGIQNAAGTLAYSPPGRNNDVVWNASNEAWRFLPNGASDVNLQWTMNGDDFSTDQNISIVLTPEQEQQLQDDLSLTLEMTVTATYATCTPGETVETSKTVNVVYLIEFPDNEPNDLVTCSATQTAIFDLTQNNSVLLGTFDPSLFTISYFLNEADALVPENAIQDPNIFEGTDGQGIFVRISDITNTCFLIKSFALIFSDDIIAPVVNFGYNPSVICVSSSSGTLTPLLADNFNTGGQFTSTTGLQIDPLTGVINLGTSTAGIYDVVYTFDAVECTDSGTFTFPVELVNAVTPIVAFNYDKTEYCKFGDNPLFTPETDFNTTGIFTVEPSTGLTIDAAGAIDLSTSTPGDYQITYTVTLDNQVCQSIESHTVSLAVVVVETPTVDVTQPTCDNPLGTIEVLTPTGITTGTPPSDLFISEVTDAQTGALSYIEIYNGTGTAKNLADYKIAIYNNGNTFISPNCDMTLTGMLSNNDVFVLAVGSNTNLGGVTPDLVVAACPGFNTNDNVRLLSSTNVLIDSWGRTDGVDFTPSNQAGYTYERNITALVPSTTWISSDWTTFDPEVYTNVGSYTFPSPTTSSYNYSLDNGTYQSDTTFTDVAPGTHTVTVYDIALDCYSEPLEVVINVSPIVIAPVVTFSYTTPVCQSDTATLTPTLATDFYTVTNGFTATPAGLIIDASTGEIDVTNSTAGLYTITYTVLEDASICLLGDIYSFDIEITNSYTPVVDFTYTSPVCQNDTNILPNTVVGFTASGTYSYTGTGLLLLDANTGEIDLTNSEPGTYEVVYTVLQSNCNPEAISTPVEVIINPSITPVVTFSYTTPVCQSTTATLTPTLATDFYVVANGFTASPAGLIIDANTGEIDVTNSTAGLYTITYSVPTDAAMCLSSDSYPFDLEITNLITPTFDFGTEETACQNTLTQTVLSDTSNNGVMGTWSPLTLDYNIIGETVYTFTPTPSSGSTSTNLIFNGDFSAGNIGFASDYSFINNAGTNGVQKAYGIVTAANLWFQFFPACVGPNPDSGNIMVVDGSTMNGGNDVVWGQSVTVVPNQNYTFSFMLQTIAIPNLAIIDATINGVSLGTTTAPSSNCEWTQVTYNWNSGSATSAQIALYDRLTISNGNDFSIDDISFVQNAISNDCAVSTTFTLTINPTVITTFDPVAPICSGDVLSTLPTTSLEGIDGEWSPALDNTTTTEYTFTPTNSTDCATTATLTITVNQPVTPTFATITICSGDVLTLPSTSLESITGTWTQAADNTMSATYDFIPDAGQCAIGGSLVVTVTQTVTPTFTPITICNGDVLTLPTSSLESITGTWAQTVDNTMNATYDFIPDVGQCAIGGSLVVTVTQPTVATFTPLASICSGETAPSLPIASIEGFTGMWTPSTISNTESGTYNFVPDAGQCASSTSINFTVTPLIVSTFAEETICNGESISFPATSAEGFTGTWSPSTINSTQSAMYTFTPTAGQCAANGIWNLVVLPQFDVVAFGECQSAFFVLSANPIEGSFDPLTVTYNWMNPNGISEGPTRTIVATETGTYTVTVTSNGCSSTASFTVDSILCVIQKGISANNDGLNDNFELTGLDVKKLDIFNRYGMKVYSKNNYTNQWIGQSDNGDELPDATYFYVIERNNGENITGWIYINRAQ